MDKDVEHDAKYWAKRIVKTAASNQDVNIFEADQLEEYTRDKCDELFLDPEPIWEHVRKIHRELADFTEKAEDDAEVEAVVGIE